MCHGVAAYFDWRERFVAFFAIFFTDLARAEVYGAAQSYLKGLLTHLNAKNCWSIAEAGGATNPQSHQRLLRKAKWDEEAFSQGWRNYIIEHYGTDEGLFILDETGFLKNGDKSVGVQPQYVGTIGKVENSQGAVFSTYTSSYGRVFYDSRLFLPQKWARDGERRKQAGVPEDVEFKTKIELAADQIDQARADELPIKWVTADSFYGVSFSLRQELIDADQRFVMATRSNTKMYKERPKILVPSPAKGPRSVGRPRTRKRIVREQYRADELAKLFAPLRL